MLYPLLTALNATLVKGYLMLAVNTFLLNPVKQLKKPVKTRYKLN